MLPRERVQKIGEAFGIMVDEKTAVEQAAIPP
jgi:hypothetical protein